MRFKFLPFFLFSSIMGDAPALGGGGGAPAATPVSSDAPDSAAPNPPSAPASQVVPPAPVPSQKADPPAPPRGPSVGERVHALLKTRGGLQAQANDLSGQVAQLTTVNQTLTTERDDAVARAEKAEAKVAEYEAELKKLEAAATTVSQGVVDQVAQLGIPEANLPTSQGGDDGEETFESLQAKLDQTTDPVERGKIAEKQIAIMGI